MGDTPPFPHSDLSRSGEKDFEERAREGPLDGAPARRAVGDAKLEERSQASD